MLAGLSVVGFFSVRGLHHQSIESPTGQVLCITPNVTLSFQFAGNEPSPLILEAVGVLQKLSPLQLSPALASHLGTRLEVLMLWQDVHCL